MPTSTRTLRQHISTKEIAAKLGVSGPTVRHWAEVGILPAPAIRSRRKWLWDLAQLEEHLTARKEAPTDAA